MPQTHSLPRCGGAPSCASIFDPHIQTRVADIPYEPPPPLLASPGSTVLPSVQNIYAFPPPTRYDMLDDEVVLAVAAENGEMEKGQTFSGQWHVALSTIQEGAPHLRGEILRLLCLALDEATEAG